MIRWAPAAFLLTASVCGDVHVLGVEDAGIDAGRPPGTPNVMFLVDKSGSMQKPADPTNPNCFSGCGTVGGPGPCPAACPTRLSELQSAMSQFLGSSCPKWRMGLMILPSPNGGSCSPSTVNDILVQLPGSSAELDAGQELTRAQAVNAQIQALVPGGGTPTAQSLANLAIYPPLLDPTRPAFVILLTDGEPNCDSANPNNCTQSQCNCTLYTGTAAVPGECPGPNCTCGADTSNASCVIGCLDQDASVTSVSHLRDLGIRTVVIGLGGETIADSGVGTGFAPGALTAMAQAGGMPTNTFPYYLQASDGPALLTVMSDLCTAINAASGLSP